MNSNIEVTKAVIPAAGLGTRFLPTTKVVPKELLPVVDRPAIHHVVAEAVRAGITDVVLVTARGKHPVEDYFDRAPELEHQLEQRGKTDLVELVREPARLVEMHSVRQPEARGLGHAVAMARTHIGDEPFAVLLPDDVMQPTSSLLADMISAYAEHRRSVIALRRVTRDEISAYGCAAVAPVDGNVVRVTGIVEKPDPDEAPSDLGVMGRYVFGPEIFDAIDRTKPGKGGEIQLTDAIGLLAKETGVNGWTFESGRFDTGRPLDYLKANVELAIDHDDLGADVRAFVLDLAARLREE